MEAPVATSRRDAIDVARILALLVVVFGHLLLAVIDQPGGAVRGANLLELHPGWAFLAALSPMPVFFAAAGWANASATPVTAAPRLRLLVGLGAVVVGTWTVAVLIATAVHGEPGIIGTGARLATQPLWFVAAYVPFAATGSRLYRLAARHFVVVVASAFAVLAAFDVARFVFGADDWIGWPGFFVAWGVAWLAGGWWRSRCADPRFHERRVGALLAIAAIGGGGVLVRFAGYSPALIDAVPDARSNTNPPTLYTAIAALAQVGLLLVFASALDSIGRRWRGLWNRAGEAAVAVYAWHLTALALCAAAIAAGLPVPERLTVAWWCTRPLWWLAVLGVAAVFVVSTDAVRRAIARPADGVLTVVRAGAGVVVATAAGAYVGLRGPGNAEQAIVSTVLFAGAWLLLRSRRSAGDAAGEQELIGATADAALPPTVGSPHGEYRAP